MVRAHTGLYIVCIRSFYLTFSCISTAQVPDDEQFVPDFQSDSRESPLPLFNSCFADHLHLHITSNCCLRILPTPKILAKVDIHF